MHNLFAYSFQTSLLLKGTILFVLGTIIGSFLNVVIYRLPIILKHKWQNECVELLGDSCKITPLKSPVNLLFPGSHCINCKGKIPYWANVPIIGYILISGKCLNCKIGISIRYPLIEILTGILFFASGLYTNDILLLAAMMVFFSYIVCLIFIDLDSYILPDELTLSLMWVGLLVNIHGLFSGSLENSVIGAVLGYMLLWIIYWVFKLITKRDGMGYGDFKFLAAILAWVGYQGIIPITLIASCAGILCFIISQIVINFKAEAKLNSLLNQQIPFGPFLGVAAITYVFINKYFIVLNLAG